MLITFNRGASLSSKNIEKPFWLKPPWQILFDLVKFSKIRPWDLNITYLLSSFLQEMEKKGYIDFAASGTALLSSSIVLRLQSENILKMEEPLEVPKQTPNEYMPPPLQLPFRFEYTSTTFDQLLNALEGALNSETMQKPIKFRLIEPPPSDLFKQYDDFFIEIESKLDDFHESLKRIGVSKKYIPFSLVVKGKSKLEIVRVFLMLLFLASKEMIELRQDEEFKEIYIILLELKESERKLPV